MEIEKGIAIPESWRRKKGESKYLFNELQVGDSFLVPKNGHKSWDFIFGAMQKAQKDFSIKLTSRLVDDDHRRIWRTE
jgi:hypothetical protein